MSPQASSLHECLEKCFWPMVHGMKCEKQLSTSVDYLGNAVWICGLMPGAVVVLIQDARGPSQTDGQFFDFVVADCDGAHKGCLHTTLPYWAED